MPLAGIYLHIPFCKQACYYCNFHFSTSLQQRGKMMAAMAKEMALTDFPALPETGKIETVYFGGGTPSLLQEAELALLFEALHRRFSIPADAEITLEANPDDISTDALALWRRLGINRLSIGIQSFEETELQWMHRAHSATQALQCIILAQQNGFQNLSADLIYGSPLLSDTRWQKNVEQLTGLQVPHISCYALTVEPRTALDKMILQHKKEAVDPDTQARQFEQLMQWMQAAGYEHYEISNFALPGWRSRHNSSYWQGKKYFGFGPSAHSFDGQRRRWNLANNSLYIQSLENNRIPFEEEILSPVQQLNEYLMISLRTLEGISLDTMEKKWGAKEAASVKQQAQKFMSDGKLLLAENHLRLSAAGKLFADGIAAELFF
ncbi:MAG: radical SAM family heme chaperone HemW [Ferruginibacter sp.]